MANVLLFAAVLLEPGTKIDVDFTHAVRVGAIGNDLRALIRASLDHLGDVA